MNCVFLSLKDFVTEADFHCVAFFVYVFFFDVVMSRKGRMFHKKALFPIYM